MWLLVFPGLLTSPLLLPMPTLYSWLLPWKWLIFYAGRHKKYFVVWKIFIFNIFSASLRLSTSTSKFSFWILFTFFGVALVDNNFSIRKGENLAWLTSSKYSMKMNLEKSTASPSESDSDRFRWVSLWDDTIGAVYFSLALHFTTHHGVQLMLGMNQGENPFALVEMEIHDQYIKTESRFRAVANFRFPAQIKFLYSQRNWLPTTAF